MDSSSAFSSPSKRASVEPQLPAILPPLAPDSPIKGSKRPPPTLLPPFEPLSSSPGLPRPVKRQNTGAAAHLKYPTPIPTSSTGILSSSPPRPQQQQHQRPASLFHSAPERTPLSAVPAVELSENGESLIMGRSSNSSHFQLSSNRLVSRIHVKARFIPAPSPLEPNRIEIVCCGWNGLKLHCQGRTWELFKGDSFTSETEGSEIMVDVQDSRVLIQWPKRGLDSAHLSDSTWDDSPRSQTREAAFLQSSPLRRTTRIASPESPTPATLSSSRRLQALTDQNIQIYEDHLDAEPELPLPPREPMDVNVSMVTDATASFSSELSEDEHHNPDEENDPIVHSFGPFGADISCRLASITTKSPKLVFKAGRRSALMAPETFAPRRAMPFDNRSPRKRVAKAESPLSSPPRDPSPREPTPREPTPREPTPRDPTPTPEPAKAPVEENPAVCNHVVNQLAYSRLSSTPLSTIMHNLPAEERRDLSKDALRGIIEATVCIGIIERQGKDAAGKLLESEYYYVPELDTDEQRRAAVVDGLRKPSLRACRKQHKQYYWKRPKTP